MISSRDFVCLFLHTSLHNQKFDNFQHPLDLLAATFSDAVSSMPAKKDLTTSPYFKSTPTRRSTRASASNTPSKSTAKKRKQYTEPDSEVESLVSEFDESGDDSASDFEKDRNAKGSHKKVKRDEDYVSEDEVEEEEEEGEESDSADDSRQMKRTVIPLAKLRDEGETEYTDQRIHQNTMLFLKDLKKHNNRDWMKCE